MLITSLEQARALAAAGVVSNDLWWAVRQHQEHNEYSDLVKVGDPTEYISLIPASACNTSLDAIEDVPCWTYGQLYSMLPERVPVMPVDNQTDAVLHLTKVSISYDIHAWETHHLFETHGPDLMANIVKAMLFITEYYKTGYPAHYGNHKV